MGLATYGHPFTGIKLGTRHVVGLWSFAYWLSVVKSAKPDTRPFEERLAHAHRADQHPEGLQRCLCPARETIEVRGGDSSRKAIPIGAVGW